MTYSFLHFFRFTSKTSKHVYIFADHNLLWPPLIKYRYFVLIFILMSPITWNRPWKSISCTRGKNAYLYYTETNWIFEYWNMLVSSHAASGEAVLYRIIVILVIFRLRPLFSCALVSDRPSYPLCKMYTRCTRVEKKSNYQNPPHAQLRNSVCTTNRITLHEIETKGTLWGGHWNS